jgi:hypothetical protein
MCVISCGCACACMCGMRVCVCMCMCVRAARACVRVCVRVCVRQTCMCVRAACVCVCDGASAPLCDGARTRPFFFGGCRTLSAYMSKYRSNWTISPATQFWRRSHAMPTRERARVRVCARVHVSQRACLVLVGASMRVAHARAFWCATGLGAQPRIGRDCVGAAWPGRACADGHSRNKPTRVLGAARRPLPF